jgi:hypothetical protein
VCVCVCAINNALQFRLVTVEEIRSTADFLQIEEEKLYEDVDVYLSK